jgi:hypothetical protein
LPAEVAKSAFGPRFQAAVATLSVRNRISRRDVVELCEQMFGSRISIGTVDAIVLGGSVGPVAKIAKVLRKVKPAEHDVLVLEALKEVLTRGIWGFEGPT